MNAPILPAARRLPHRHRLTAAPVHPGLVTWPQLQTLCAPAGARPTRETVKKWADAQGIPYLSDRNGGLFTTVEALNRAMGMPGMGDLAPRIEDLMP